jgi:hypothetical protein
MKKLESRNRVKRRPPGRETKSKDSTASLRQQIEDLSDRLDIVLPEVTARVAALEHLLLELNLCTLDDLRGARQFVKIQEE